MQASKTWPSSAASAAGECTASSEIAACDDGAHLVLDRGRVQCGEAGQDAVDAVLQPLDDAARHQRLDAGEDRVDQREEPVGELRGQRHETGFDPRADGIQLVGEVGRIDPVEDRVQKRIGGGNGVEAAGEQLRGQCLVQRPREHPQAAAQRGGIGGVAQPRRLPVRLRVRLDVHPGVELNGACGRGQLNPRTGVDVERLHGQLEGLEVGAQLG